MCCLKPKNSLHRTLSLKMSREEAPEFEFGSDFQEFVALEPVDPNLPILCPKPLHSYLSHAREEASEMEDGVDYEVFAGLEPLDPNLPWDWDMVAKAEKQKKATEEEEEERKSREVTARQEINEQTDLTGSHEDAGSKQRTPTLPSAPRDVEEQTIPDDAVVKQQTLSNPSVRLVRPDWLPPDWLIKPKERTKGKRAGMIDKYFEDPTHTHLFKSKKHVLYYLSHGEKMKTPRRLKNAKSENEGCSRVPEFVPPKENDVDIKKEDIEEAK